MLRSLGLFLIAWMGWPTSSWCDDGYITEIVPLLTQSCARCHNADVQEGKFRIDHLTSDLSDRDQVQAWLEVRNRINLGEMPPPDETELTPDQIQTLSHWITDRLRQSERSRLSGEGRVMMRRMNRHEYTYTVSDLLSMPFPTGDSPLDTLPPDGTAEGFDKVSSALMFDPSLMTQYYEVARQIANRAIVDGQPEYPTEKMRLEFEDIPDSPAIGYLVTRLGMRPVPGGLELSEGGTRSFGMLRYPGRRDNNVAPINGFYRFTIRAGGSAGSDGSPPRIQLTHSHPDESQQLLMEFDVEAPMDKPEEYSVVLPRDTLGNELSIRLVNEQSFYMSQRPGESFMRRNSELGKEGKFAETLKLDGRKIAEGWGGDRSTPDPEKLNRADHPRVFLDYLEVEGPLYDQWPPKSHTMVLGTGKLPNPDHPETRGLIEAREIFNRFLPIAWRRPIRPEEVEPIVLVVSKELENGQSFHEAIRVGLTASLTSPKFLYLNESSISDEASLRPLNDYELASRLSYFLWSSMPDSKLIRLAEQGQLTEPRVLTAQVDRMLKDPKSQRWIEGFVRQWLQTDRFLTFTPDRFLYKEYDDKLAAAVVQEPLEFVRVLLDEDLSALNLIDSDFLVLNQRLAEHYSIPEVRGDSFRKVARPENSPRGGLLGMAGVHQAGSDGIRTKPVSRAVYVREVLFNDPPDPPPPNAGEVEPNIQGERLTVRERLLQHQQIGACAACHRNLDPYGLALENFNVVGQWRDQQDGEDFRGKNRPTIIASGQLPNGDKFDSFFEFKERLLSQQDRFRRSLAEKMLVYALGRPIQIEDESLLEKAVLDMQQGGDSLRSLIHSLVTSKAFLTK